ncbi:unnamed protein product [Caenorhabditis angaria]|uniref:Uncharacterized protein n=1 Tax=Caenorhabditis angaria TaxID=860376 RepID=A0A9P1IZ69_9PELO|nr:unnamed protein product [Caenorhabditis angaria]
MSFSLEMRQFPPAPRDCYAVPGKPSINEELTIIKWEHMNPNTFIPSALFSTWSIRTALYPLSVLRSQLQLQKQNTIYKNTFDAYKDISKREGIRGLYRGFWITVPQIGSSLVYSTVFEKFRSVIHDNGFKSISAVASISSGCASLATQFIFVPTDIIAQYMMIYKNQDRLTAGHDKQVVELIQKQVKNGRTLGLSVVSAVYKADGISGFFRGFFASAIVYVPQMMMFWPVYYATQEVLNKLHPPTNRSIMYDQAFSAVVGGMVATVATNPMELFRVRIQMHRGTYTDTLRTLVTDEKGHLFTKGLAPRLIANSLYSGLVVVGYEIVKRLCVREEYKDRVKW